MTIQIKFDKEMLDYNFTSHKYFLSCYVTELKNKIKSHAKSEQDGGKSDLTKVLI